MVRVSPPPVRVKFVGVLFCPHSVLADGLV